MLVSDPVDRLALQDEPQRECEGESQCEHDESRSSHRSPPCVSQVPSISGC